LGFNFIANEPFFYHDEHEDVLGDGIFRGTQFGFFSSWAYYLVRACLVNGIIYNNENESHISLTKTTTGS
jgi:hypothetical protein